MSNQSKEEKYANHVTRSGETRNAQKCLVETSEQKTSLGNQGVEGIIILKRLLEIGYGGGD
jgi:hypothetical protein